MFFYKYVLAIDIGGSKMLASIVDSDGNPAIVFRKEFSSAVSVSSLTEDILTTAKKAMDATKRKAEAIGVTIPGVADTIRGLWHYAPFSGVSNFPIGQILEEAFHLPVFIDNDVNACALGERMYGCCRDTDDFAWITISNGVGGAIFSSGQLIRGFSNGAGEIGHIVVEPDGNLCPCSHRGCLEAHASGRAIAAAYEKMTGMQSTAKKIAQLARIGDQAARQVYNQTGFYLGKAASYIANIVNPEKIVFGGGVSMDFDLLEGSIRDALDQMAFTTTNQGLKLCKTALDYNAALIGAATVAQTKGGKYIA